MKPLSLLFLLSLGLVLAYSIPGEADEQRTSSTLLEQLERETVLLTKRADLHRVTVVMGGVHRVPGVLVGTPAYVVTPSGTTPVNTASKVQLASGKKVDAKVVFSDAELGIAVHAFGADAPKGLVGLPVRRDWNYARGQVVVAGDKTPALALIDGVDRMSGRIRAGETPPGSLLLDSRGRIAGLGGAGGIASCSACHANNLQIVGSVANWQGRKTLKSTLQYHWPTTEQNVRDHWYVVGVDGSVNALSRNDGRAIWRIQHPSITTGHYHRAVGALQGHGLSLNTFGTPSRPAHPGHYVAGPVIARVIEDLKQHGRVRYAYLGVVPGSMTTVNKRRGVKLDTVLEGSPAASAGVKPGDVLISVDGHPCRDPGTLGRLLVQKQPGESTRLEIAGREAELSVRLADRGEARAAQIKPADLGLTVVELGKDLRAFLDVGGETVGVVVRDVKPGSAAQRAGLERGDVVVAGGGGPVRDVAEFEAVVATANQHVKLTLRGRDGGKSKELVLTLPGPNRRAR